jgi:hypothetical protein
MQKPFSLLPYPRRGGGISDMGALCVKRRRPRYARCRCFRGRREVAGRARALHCALMGLTARHHRAELILNENAHVRYPSSGVPNPPCPPRSSPGAGGRALHATLAVVWSRPTGALRWTKGARVTVSLNPTQKLPPQAYARGVGP